MAVIIPTTTTYNKLILVRWSNIKNGDTGSPVEVARFSDKTVQIFGTFGSGGTLVLQGSNDINLSNWFTIKDANFSEISKTSAYGGALIDNPLFIRPNVTAGDSNTNLNVVICCKE